jgi:hypothetical protein
MKLVEFSIAEDFTTIERGTDRFDLHNCFDFQSLSYNPTQQTLDLCWRRSNREWVKPTEPAELHIIFSGVYLLKAIERDVQMPFTEDDCLDTLGFIWNYMLAEVGFTSNTPSEGCNVLSLSFMSGFNLKIGAESANLVVSS